MFQEAVKTEMFSWRWWSGCEGRASLGDSPSEMSTMTGCGRYTVGSMPMDRWMPVTTWINCSRAVQQRE